MRFLADESCDFAIARALRAAGHDVLAVAEVAPSADDTEVIARALDHERILLTEDKDFGDLVFAHGERAHGVILLRYPRSARDWIARDVVRLVEAHGERLPACFVVVRPGRIRITQPRRP